MNLNIKRQICLLSVILSCIFFISGCTETKYVNQTILETQTIVSEHTITKTTTETITKPVLTTPPEMTKTITITENHTLMTTPATTTITSTTSSTDITITSKSTINYVISSVILKILKNDKESIIIGFNFLDVNDNPVSFSGSDNARFCGSVWQGHIDKPLSYIVEVDTHINTSQDTITIPYSILNFKGVDKSQNINFDFRIYGPFTNTPNYINLESYYFQLTTVISNDIIQLASSITGQKG
jgi:hypothetical protein